MKYILLLIGIFSFMTFASFAQTEKSERSETEPNVIEFKMKTENLDELKNIDWIMVKEMFNKNDAEQEITLAFEYKSKNRVQNFEMKLTGKTADLEKLIARLKKMLKTMVEIDSQAAMRA